MENEFPKENMSIQAYVSREKRQRHPVSIGMPTGRAPNAPPRSPNTPPPSFSPPHLPPIAAPSFSSSVVWQGRGGRQQ